MLYSFLSGSLEKRTVPWTGGVHLVNSTHTVTLLVNNTCTVSGGVHLVNSTHTLRLLVNNTCTYSIRWSTSDEQYAYSGILCTLPKETSCITMGRESIPELEFKEAVKFILDISFMTDINQV